MRTLRAASVAVLLALALAGCSSGTGSAFGYGAGDDAHSVSGEPVDQGEHAVIGVELDNGSDDAARLLAVTAQGATNIRVGRSWVAPVLRQRDGDFLLFGVNRVADDATLGREWLRRAPAAGYRIRPHQHGLQALLEISVRDPRRPARVVAVVLTYLQDGRRLTETTYETACFFTPHRRSVCDLPG